MSIHPTTLITGAAKRIGAAIALHLAAHGHHLVLHYHQSKTEAVTLAAKLRSLYAIEVTLVQANLAHPLSLEGFWHGLPPVTQLIHNAALFTRDRLENFTGLALRTQLAVNLEAPLVLTQGFMAQLPKGVTGNIICLSDGTMGWSISPHFFTYAVSKHAGTAVIDLLASACAPRARVNALALGPTLESDADPEGLFDRLAARAPLQCTGSISELCAAIDFLHASPSITGQTLSLASGLGLSTYRQPTNSV